jgi:hypothetical protein
MYSVDGTCSLSGMIINMCAPEFFERFGLVRKCACVYAADWPDAFAFMHRTGTGFWTWTLIHHFSRRPTTALRSRADVIVAAGEIAREIRFIRLEAIDAEARRVFGPRRGDAMPLNVTPRPDRLQLLPGTAEIADRLDGDIAHILGGYRVLNVNHPRETAKTFVAAVDAP